MSTQVSTWLDHLQAVQSPVLSTESIHNKIMITAKRAGLHNLVWDEHCTICTLKHGFKTDKILQGQQSPSAVKYNVEKYKKKTLRVVFVYKKIFYGDS